MPVSGENAADHATLDADRAFQEEVRNVARAVAHAVGELRTGRLGQSDRGLPAPHPK